MQTKQDAIISFSATVKNVLDTTKATIALEDSDIIVNCNTSVFTARKHIRDSISILDYHRRHKEVQELVDDAYKVVNAVNFLYLMPYGEYFIRWSEHQFQKEMGNDESFLEELYAIQAMERKCKYYDNMVDTLKEVQKMFIGFSDKLQKNLNTLQPSEFELSKKGINKKTKISRQISSSCEDLSSTSSDSFKFVPTVVSKSTTKHIVAKLGIVSAGVSRTTSSESLHALSS